MSTYLQWSVALVQHFFGSQAANQRVRLMVTRDILDQDFATLGGCNAFVAAMVKGPFAQEAGGSMHKRGLELYKIWKTPRLRPPKYPKTLADLDDAPPFLPYLCLLCLAWTEGGEDLAANAYYERLTLLHPNHDLGTHLGSWLQLWQGIEEWTRRLQDRRGKFVVEQLGGWVNVGVPRSQVIFTPAKIERFPELFHFFGIEADASVSREQLRHLILASEAMAISVLGPMVVQEIKANSPIGGSALDVIREYLENWDGESPTSSTTPVGERGETAGVFTLLLALRPVDDNSRWQATLALEREARADRVAFPARRWNVHPHSETVATLVDEACNSVDASQLSSEWTTGLILDSEFKDGERNEAEAVCKLPAKYLRTFDRWAGDLLVECKSLPSQGPAYILVHRCLLSNWGKWIAFFEAQAMLVNVTWTGLPDGQLLFCFPEVRSIPTEFRALLPAEPGTRSRTARTLRLASGTRCNSSTARRVYAEYDPPLLIVLAPESATLSVSGAKETRIDRHSSLAGLPGNTVRAFTLTVDSKQAVVIATLQHEGKQIGIVSFGIHHEATVLDAGSPTVFFDRLGNVSQSDGVIGLMVPEHESRWSLKDGNHELGKPIDESVWREKSFNFIESLSHQGGRLVYPEYKRRAMQIADADAWRISEETRCLAQLGFIELQTDSRGRWSHVHPVPAQIYPLPWQSDGRYQFVLAGTADAKRFEKAARLAADVLDCEVRVAANKLKIVPPRITMLHHELAAGHQIAEEMGLQWTPEPPANQISAWAGGLGEWLKQITWFPDPGPIPLAEYSPEEFRFVPHQQFAAPWHLRRFVDPFTMQQWHCLYQPEGCRYIAGRWEEHGKQHAYVRDFTWAMWRVHMAIAEDDLTNLAYDTRKNRLIVPCQMHFPYLLGRALVACSGLPPENLYNCAPYINPNLGVILPDALPYTGQCLAYQFVPRTIAEVIANKVSARLVDVSVD